MGAGGMGRAQNTRHTNKRANFPDHVTASQEGLIQLIFAGFQWKFKSLTLDSPLGVGEVDGEGPKIRGGPVKVPTFPTTLQLHKKAEPIDFLQVSNINP